MKPMQKTHTLIISDVHLGSEVSRARALEETLKGWEFSRLILLGDIFDALNFSRLTEDHWHFLSYIRSLSDPQKPVEVVWIVGNHDELLTKVAPNLLGIEVREEYRWEYNGEQYLAIHGHQYDRFMIDNKMLSDIASALYLFLQKIDLKKRRLSRLVKRMSKKWLRLSEKIARSAIRYGKREGVRYIFCGHTHLSLTRSEKRIDYYNTGCWTDIPSTFVTIDETGIEIHRIS